CNESSPGKTFERCFPFPEFPRRVVRPPSLCAGYMCVSLRGTAMKMQTLRMMGMVAVCAALSVKAAASQAAGPPANSLEILEARPSFFVIATAGPNIGVQVGEDGVVAVDAGSAADAPAVPAAIRRISPKPIRYIIDTGPDTDHVGGNEALSQAGEKL